ncbi:hypothetical protein GA0061099_10314 [Bradyrhizobium yuanmingense]|uniref:Uncharacterized protein n=1 Tax=Bradyrhizobium yuanmingense TaxID=108015 RepID=A0A1C3XJ77_9BRAD|nr:XRE family transcriptional regulator [Bradyrhizobium yuanmingense]TWI17482.1 hypothetical protein IQ15_07414 [Bradyrhizobium yuanmingense]SCB52337.1 hypothetical protein GA0061099_10314 [Bradyrhizobium yuanmingense]
MTNAKKSTRGRSISRVRKSKPGLTMSLKADFKTLVTKGVRGVKLKAPGAAKKSVGLLIKRYGEAFAKSNRAGRGHSFLVNVDPDGRAVATPIERSTTAGRRAVETRTAGPHNAELEEALAAARERERERGRARAAEILSSEDMLSADALAKLLHTTRVTINAKRQNGQLVGLDGAKRGFRFPVWQLDRDGKPYPELPGLRERLGGPWAVFRFLVQPHDELDGLTGREALELGRGEDLLAAAESVGRGDFR